MADSAPLSIIILAAGKGTRMKSRSAKVLHQVFHRPMVHHVILAAQQLRPKRILVIVGHDRLAVEQAILPYPGVECLFQEQQLGTGHAVMVAEDVIHEPNDPVIIMCGDTPLIQPQTLQEMYDSHLATAADLTLMTTVLENPTNYGRIITDSDGMVTGIVEEKDADADQRVVREINAGIYCVQRNLLFSLLQTIGSANAQGEMYLTDIVAKAVAAQCRIEKFTVGDPLEVLGVNSRSELVQAHQAMQLRRNRQMLAEGVTLYSPETTAIFPDATVGQDSVLMASVQISGTSRIGTQCHIGQGAILHNCQVGDAARIGPYCCLADCTIKANSSVPAFSTSPPQP